MFLSSGGRWNCTVRKFAAKIRQLERIGHSNPEPRTIEPHLGPPQNPIVDAMRVEHTAPRDTTMTFSTSNGFVGALSATEWEYVVAPQPDKRYGCRDEFLREGGTESKRRQPVSLDV